MVLGLLGCFSPLEESSDIGDLRAITRRLGLIARYNQQNGLPNAEIEDIVSGPEGQIYLSLSSVEAQSDSVILFRRDADGNAHLSSVQVEFGALGFPQLAVASDGRVLFLRRNGVDIISNQNNVLSITSTLAFPGVAYPDVRGVGFDPVGRLYVGESAVVRVYDQGIPANAQAQPSRTLQAQGPVFQLRSGNNGRMYMGTGSRQFAIVEQGGSALTTYDIPPRPGRITSTAFDRTNNRFIIGTPEGVYIYHGDNGQLIRHYTMADGLANDFVHAVEVSPDGRLIFVGLVAYDGNPAGVEIIADGVVQEHYSLANLHFTAESSIRSIRYNPIDGNLYVGSTRGELAILTVALIAQAESHSSGNNHEHGNHRIVARKGADNHSSILPHPPRIETPGAPHSESWGHWFGGLSCALLSFESSHPAGACRSWGQGPVSKPR